MDPSGQVFIHQGGAGNAFWKETTKNKVLGWEQKEQLGPWVSFSSPSSSEVTHVVMEETSAKEAICWQKDMNALLPDCPQPALLDISWFTESMAAGQPVPEEVRHRLEVS